MAKVYFILPAYNEVENLLKLFESIDISMSVACETYRIIVVDDGSTDGTLALAKENARTFPIQIVIHSRNMNLGATLRDGIETALDEAEADDVIVTMDADNTHPPNLSLEMLRAIRSGHDLVVASRYAPGAKEVGLSWYRIFFSKGINLVLQVLFPIRNIRDYTCGYRAYKAPLLKEAFNQHKGNLIEEKGFTCMVELILKLRPFLQAPKEVPLVLRYDFKIGRSKMRVGRTITAYLRLLFEHLFLHKYHTTTK